MMSVDPSLGNHFALPNWIRIRSTGFALYDEFLSQNFSTLMRLVILEFISIFSTVLWIWIYWIRIQHSSESRFGSKYSWKKLSFFIKKIAIYLSLGLHKGRPSYRESLQPSKENIQHFKTWNFSTFFYFCGSILPSWIRIHRSYWIRIQAENTGVNHFKGWLVYVHYYW